MRGFFVALLLVLGTHEARAEIIVSSPDPAVAFRSGNVSLLVSQIGYSVSGVRTAYLVSNDKAAGDAVLSYSVEDDGGAVVATGKPAYAGQWVTAHFWTLDLAGASDAGKYRLKAGALVSQLFHVASPRSLYFDPLYSGMMFGQMKLRERTDSMGGFIDCGSDIRETNSHVTQMCGMLDMLELHPDWFSAAEKTEAQGLFSHFRDFIVAQQDSSGRILGGFWTGSQITMGEWPNHLLGTYGLLRLAKHAGGDAALLARAKQAIDRIQASLPIAQSLSTFLTLDLLIEAEYDAQTGDAAAFARAKAVAKELSARQVQASKPTAAGLYGLFVDPDQSLSRLNYHAPGDLNGEFWGLPLTGLIMLSEKHPTDPDAAMWRSMLSAFVEGTLKQTTAMSPMGLVANGEYQGVRWFSDLFHGMSMTYGLMAAQLVRYGTFLGDPSLYALAEKQLLWVGGLNTGDGFPATPQPMSCIVGQGYRFLNDGYGQFSRIPGSIVNGLSATAQFQKQMPSGPEAPSNLCDESWISHTGGWLSGTAELLAMPSPSSLLDGGAEGGDGAAGGKPIADGGGGTAGSVVIRDASGAGGSAVVEGGSSDEPADESSSCACRAGRTGSGNGLPFAAALALLISVRARRRSV